MTTKNYILYLYNEYTAGRDISWGDLAFLTEPNTRRVIRKHFYMDPGICEFAGIPEELFNKWNNR